jgi:hypothetical protein
MACVVEWNLEVALRSDLSISSSAVFFAAPGADERFSSAGLVPAFFFAGCK